MKSVSIIIPAYNVAGYIEVCLDSILSQTYTDFEVIVVDDGSTDATGHITDGYASLDDRVKVIHLSNQGVSAARNAGIQAAAGMFFLFFDGDDFIEPGTLADLVAEIRDKGADVLIYGYHRYGGGQITQTVYPVFGEGLYEGEAVITELLSRFVGCSAESINRWVRGEKDSFYIENPALWRCMARASLIRENSLTFDVRLKVGEDTVFMSDLLSCAASCYVIHKCYYYLVYRESSVIAVYEKDAAAKLEGKQRLVDSRGDLTKRVLLRSGTDITPFWQGSVIMSVLELAFLYTKGKSVGMPFSRKYGAWLSYAKRPEVRETVSSLKLKFRFSVRYVPFLMLKLGLHFPLFLCAALLNLARYDFVRE